MEEHRRIGRKKKHRETIEYGVNVKSIKDAVSEHLNKFARDWKEKERHGIRVIDKRKESKVKNEEEEEVKEKQSNENM